MTYGFPAGVGGATAFTELSDAPATITPARLLVSNAEGTALVFENSVQIEALQSGEDFANVSFTLSAFAAEYALPEADVNISANSQGGNGISTFELTALSDSAEANFKVTAVASEGGATVDVFKAAACDFTMANFDVVATDTNARLTVGEVSYAVAKAIQVKIGSDTHYWPLFGGEDAGPAPAPSIVETIVPNGVVIGNDAGTALLMSAAISVGAGGIDIDAPGGLSLTSTTGHSLDISGGGGVSVEALGSGDVVVTTANDVFVSGDTVDLTVTTALTVNSAPTVATQTVLVAGVGTLTFTHGLLTGFTPA